MAANIIHPYGLSPPPEWAGRKSIPAAEYQEWLAIKPGDKPKRRGKFNANIGHRADLGFSVRSSLEADMARLLLFQGYQRWTEPHPGTPPAEGLWFRYEGREFDLQGAKGRTDVYKPDWHIWDHGIYHLAETKGVMDARSKKHMKLMAQHHPEIPLELITRPILEQMKAEALYAARRQNGNGQPLDVPGWEGRKEGA